MSHPVARQHVLKTGVLRLLLFAFVLMTAGFIVVPTPALAAEEKIPVFRLYNQYTGEHLLTSDEGEYWELCSIGWTGEYRQFDAYASGGIPIYRLFNPYNSDHHYTKDYEEYLADQDAGWIGEGIKLYSASSAAAEAEPVYRLWNSQQTANGGVGSHLWTVNEEEYNSLPAITDGAWRQEGIAFYGAGDTTNWDDSTGRMEETLSTSDYNGIYYRPGVWKEDSASIPEYGVTILPDESFIVELPDDWAASWIDIGDVVVLPPTETYPGGIALKVTDERGLSSGSYLLYGETPAIGELVSSIDIQGNGKAILKSLELEDGVTANVSPENVHTMESEANLMDVFGDDHIDIDQKFELSIDEKKLGDHAKVSGKVSVGFDYLTAIFDADVNGLLPTDIDVHSFEISVHEKAEVYGKISYDYEKNAYLTKDEDKPWSEERVELATLNFAIPECPVLDVKLTVYGTFSVKGTAEIDVVATAAQGVSYDPWNGVQPIADFDKEIKTLEAKGDIRAGAGATAELSLFTVFDLAGYYGEVGPAVHAEFVAHDRPGGPLWCAEGSFYIYAKHGLAKDNIIGELLNLLFDDLSLDFEVLKDDDSNPLRIAQHFENGLPVDECTWSEEDPGGSEDPGGGSEDPGGGSEEPGGSEDPGGGSENPGEGGESPATEYTLTFLTGSYRSVEIVVPAGSTLAESEWPTYIDSLIPGVSSISVAADPYGARNNNFRYTGKWSLYRHENVPGNYVITTIPSHPLKAAATTDDDHSYLTPETKIVSDVILCPNYEVYDAYEVVAIVPDPDTMDSRYLDDEWRLKNANGWISIVPTTYSLTPNCAILRNTYNHFCNLDATFLGWFNGPTTSSGTFDFSVKPMDNSSYTIYGLSTLEPSELSVHSSDVAYGSAGGGLVMGGSSGSMTSDSTNES